MEHLHVLVYSQLLTFDQIWLFLFVNQSSVLSIASPGTMISYPAHIYQSPIRTNKYSQSLTINDLIFYIIWMQDTTVEVLMTISALSV